MLGDIMNRMDYKVSKIYSLMLSNYKKLGYEVEAEGTLKALVEFKQRHPTRKCLYWVAK
jgi:hypothetical protein